MNQDDTTLAPAKKPKTGLKGCQVQPHELELVWPYVEPLVQEALDNGAQDMFVTDVLFALTRGLMQLFVAIDEDDKIQLCMVTELIRRNLHNVVHIVALAGKRFSDARAFEAAFETWCRENGAVAIEANCRPAQVRLFRRLGYEPIYQKIRKPLVRRH